MLSWIDGRCPTPCPAWVWTGRCGRLFGAVLCRSEKADQFSQLPRAQSERLNESMFEATYWQDALQYPRQQLQKAWDATRQYLDDLHKPEDQTNLLKGYLRMSRAALALHSAPHDPFGEPPRRWGRPPPGHVPFRHFRQIGRKTRVAALESVHKSMSIEAVCCAREHVCVFFLYRAVNSRNCFSMRQHVLMLVGAIAPPPPLSPWHRLRLHWRVLWSHF